MPLVDTLHVVAELAVAFAGFASLVSIIGSRRGRDAPNIDAARIRSMLEASLLVAAFALVPILIFHSGLPTSASWRASSGMFAIAAAVIMVLQARRTYLATDPAGYRPSASWLITTIALWTVTLSTLIATALGAVKNAAFGYGVALFAFLVFAALLFIRLIASLLAGPDSNRDMPAV